jgi:hypothetical protein
LPCLEIARLVLWALGVAGSARDLSSLAAI